jgi:prepilin-type N-terminal cleavage/methylation domain-containing protein
MALRTRSHGFTIIELILCVAIIGVLSTLAIPLLQRAQLRAKAAEGRMNIQAIRGAEEAFYAEANFYVSALPVTPAAIGGTKVAWGLSPSDSHGFNDLGFFPQGMMHFQYGVTSNGSTAFTIEARSDLDGDGAYNTWGYVKPVSGTSAGIAGPLTTCPNTGVIDPDTGIPNALNLVGACDPSSRVTEY